MAEDIVSIGIALDTSKVLAGTRQVDAALKSVATASATTAQATQKIDQAARAAGQAFATQSSASQALGQSLRQQALAAQDADQKTRAMQKGAQDAAAALQKEQQAALAAAEALHKKGQAAGTTTGLMDRLKASVGDFGRNVGAFALAQAGVAGLQQAFSTLTSAVSGAVQAAVKMESLQASFKFVSGSAQAASADLGFLRQTAERLGVSFVGSAKGFQQMSAAAQHTKVAGQGVRDIFTAIAEKGRVLGLSAQEIQGAMLAVSQSFSKGTITAEELRGQFAERMPGAINEMARAMGVGTAELGKMMEKGELGIEGWVRWAQVVKQDLGGATQDAARTAGAAFERFHNTMHDFQVNVGQFVIVPLGWIVDKMNAVVGAANKAKDAIAAVATAERDAAKQSEELAGGKGVAMDLQRQRTAAVAEEAAARAARIGAGAIAGQGSPQYAAAQERENAIIAKRLDLERQLAIATKTRDEVSRKLVQRTGDPLGEGAVVELGAVDEKRVAAQKQLTDMVKTNREELDKLDRSTQQLYGRKPTQDEILKTTEKQVEATRKWIDANQENWNLYKDTGPAKELRAQAAGAEALEKSIKAAGEATRAKEKADSDAAQKRKQAEKDEEENARKSIERFKDIGAEEDRNIEQLRRMAAQYGEVKTVRDADTASVLAQSLATSQYNNEAQNHLKIIQDTTKALEDRAKTEAKLPKLREEAEASAGALRDIQRLQKQLEPSRRSMSREEQLAAMRAELAERSKNDLATMARADEQIKKTLDTEMWDQWRDVGLDALDHVGQALEDFAFKGKLTFKDMMGAIAQDLFHFATQTLMQSATKKGGWLEAGLDLGLKVLGIAGGGTGGGGGGAYALADIDMMQHGGPVMGGTPYVVGERGPELFVPKTSGTVLPHGQGVSSPTVVNVHVSGVQDVQSFVQSRGAVSRAMMGALAQARQQM
jgi:tape measure domain-containing protein